MRGFVRKLEETVKDEEERKFLSLLKESIEQSEEYVGIPFTYDLESLMAVLEGLVEKKPSVPLMAFVCHLTNLGIIDRPGVKDAKEKFGEKAHILLPEIKKLIFQESIRPVKEGKAKRTLAGDLDRFYGPLLLLLANTKSRVPINGLSSCDDVQWIFTTNWDTCIRDWIKSRNFTLNDGITRDPQGRYILDVRSGWRAGSRFSAVPSYGSGGRDESGFNVVPIHGSTELTKTMAPSVYGERELIERISPEHMKEEMAERTYLIYPLEAVGYENAVRSPYIDMLYQFREKMMDESVIYVGGFSFRDPTVASIFEEVLRSRGGEWAPLEGEPEKRVKTVFQQKPKLKIIVLDSEPLQVLENVREFYNLYHAIIPIQVSFPALESLKFSEKYALALTNLGAVLAKLFDNYREVSQSLGEIQDIWELPLDPSAIFRQ